MKRERLTGQLRAAALALLFIAGIPFLCGDPVEGTVWAAHFWLGPAVGFGIWGLMALLYRRWRRRGLLPDSVTREE